MTAVIAHAESTGATVLAEGIETPANVDRALALGSSLGQGWHFGRAGSLPTASPPITAPIALATSPRQIPQTPFDMVADHPALRRAPKSLLTRFSRFVEDHALSLPAPPIVLGAFQTAERFTPATAERYARIADRCPLVGALGERLAAAPIRGVRGAKLAADDRLVGEWTVVVVAAHYAGALIARDVGDDGPDDQRRFDYVLTHDRATVLSAGRSLMSRLLPTPT